MLEYEHGAKEALARLAKAGDLVFETVGQPNQTRFLEEDAPLYASMSFRQGKEFFAHAERSSLLAKPLLLYYGMLATVKASLVFQFPDFFLTRSHLKHGLTSGEKIRDRLDFERESVRILPDGVYPLARKAIGLSSWPDDSSISVQEILTRLPGVNESYRIFCHKALVPDNLAHITGDIVYYEPAEGGFMASFWLPKKELDKFGGRFPDLSSFFGIQDAVDQNGQPIRMFRSKAYWGAAELARQNLPLCVTTAQGTSGVLFPVVVGKHSVEVSEIELYFMIMYYLSELARYQPKLWLEVQSGTKDLNVLLCRDLIQTCENRFLDLLQARLATSFLLPLQ